ncbi:hypothetical protein CYMTET_35598 [Cymbomonas tetramitiformis]|uniref:SF3 helicase domain-containing protein n=1 Tax=Cymbomonas tetramitiformis TaxID=36881 RepID=A0AAE0KNV3_9CHLO|nr:hypothetical protein CYMTET_35598 [Cymbomonas tetramitiformis]
MAWTEVGEHQYGRDGFAQGARSLYSHNTSFIWAPSASPNELQIQIFKNKALGATHAERHLHKLRLSTDVFDTSAAKAFTSFTDCATFAEKLLPRLCELGLNHFYEQLTGPVRFYTDIEWYAHNVPTHVTEKTKIAFLKAFMECAEDSLRSKCKVDVDRATFRNSWRLSEASNEKKASFHVTLIDVGHFRSNQVIKHLQIIQDITEKLKTKNSEFADFFTQKGGTEKGVPLDTNPYAKDNSFRLLLCAKKTDPQRPLRPVRITRDNKLETIPDGEYNYLDYVVSHIPDGESVFPTVSILNQHRRQPRVCTQPGVLRTVLHQLMPAVFDAIHPAHKLHAYKDAMLETTAKVIGQGDFIMVSISAQTNTCPWKVHKKGGRTDTVKLLFRKDDIRLTCWDPDCRRLAGNGNEQQGYIPVKYPTPELGRMARELFRYRYTDTEGMGGVRTPCENRSSERDKNRTLVSTDTEEPDTLVEMGSDTDDADEEEKAATSKREMTTAVNREASHSFEQIIIALHDSEGCNCTAQMATHLRKAVFKPTQQHYFAEYAFDWLMDKYRYAYDKSNGAYILFRFDGALWSLSGAKESMEYEVKEWAIRLFDKLLSTNHWGALRDTKTLRGMAKKLAKLHNEDHQTVKWTKQDVLAILTSDNNIVQQIEAGLAVLDKGVGTECVFSSLKTAMERVLKVPKRYTQLGLPTPEEFFDRMDERAYLIGFDNGVYDLETDHFYPKGTVPNDFLVSMSVGYDFRHRDSHLDAQMRDIDRSLYRRIFPEEVTRSQIQAVVGSLLSSGNPMKKLVLMLGEGDNGKSAFVCQFLKRSLGDYFGTVAIQVLTERKEGADAPNPALSVSRKRRCIALNEGDKRMKLNSGVTKTLTGNDDVQFRNLFKQPISAKFHAKFMYLSNVAPEIESGKAMGERAYPIACVATFVKGLAPEDEVHEIHRYRAWKDTEFMKKCEEWRLAHMHMMLEWWRNLYTNDFVLPTPPNNSSALHLLQEASHDGLFKTWLHEHHETITTPPTLAIDALRVADIRSAYNSQTTRPDLKFSTDNECKKALESAGVRIVDQQRMTGNRDQRVRNFVFLKLACRSP